MQRRSVMGRLVIDRHGERVGSVIDTWPYDGGGEVEMVVLRLGRVDDERRMLPAAGLTPGGPGVLRTPYSRRQVEDAPALGYGRHAAAADERAVSHWSWEEPALAGTLARRWLRSSGSSATARRFPTDPSPTTSVS